MAFRDLGALENDEELRITSKIYKSKEHRISDKRRIYSSFFAFLFFITTIIGFIGSFNSHDYGAIFMLIGMFSFMLFFGTMIVNIHETDVCENIYEDKG